MPSALRRLPGAAFALALGLSALSACGGGSEQAPPAATMPRTLRATPSPAQVPPGGTTTLGFGVTGPTGAPLPGVTVSFAIVDDPSMPNLKAQGATLAATSATTDAQGTCGVRVTAGLETTFRVRATSANATV